MSASPQVQTAESCLRRAGQIRATAEALQKLGDEWFAVCYFYSAYHTVRAAFIEDPVFDSSIRLSKIDVNLVLEDRYVRRHTGRVSGGTRSLGVNDIVRKIYPQIAVEYIRLHMASISVRYGEGLGAISGETVLADYLAVVEAQRTGSLKA